MGSPPIRKSVLCLLEGKSLLRVWLRWILEATCASQLHHGGLWSCFFSEGQACRCQRKLFESVSSSLSRYVWILGHPQSATQDFALHLPIDLFWSASRRYS